jgi:branched-chain amino acid transport system substrate-binding protein
MVRLNLVLSGGVRWSDSPLGGIRVLGTLRDALVASIVLAALGVMPARGEIFIATAGPMSGPYLAIGEQFRWGAEQAVADINARGGVLGEAVRLVVGDDACDSEQAVAVAQKLVTDGAVFIAGHYCSGSSIPASKVYEDAGVLMISPGSTNPRFTDEGGASVFRVCGRDDAQGAVAGAHLAERWGDKRIAILHDQTAYGEGLATETRKELNRLGVREAIYAAYEPGLGDYSHVAANLEAARIDVVYVGGYSTEAALILRQAHDMGYALQLVGGDAIVTDDFWAITGPAGEGTLLTFFPDPRPNPEAAEAVAAFRAKGFEPEGNTLYAYAAVQTWAQAVEKAGSLDLNGVIEALRREKFATVLGEIAFDAKGDVTTTSFVWYRWTDGKYVAVK